MNNLVLNLVLFLVVAASTTSANIVCPNAAATSYGNGQLDCAQPVCLKAQSKSFPSPDPTKYFVCAGRDYLVEMKCSPGTCFNYEKQGCVHPWDWSDLCIRKDTQSSTTTTTTTTPAPETTDEVEVTVTEPIPSTTTSETTPSTTTPSTTTPSTTTPSTTTPSTTTSTTTATPETTTTTSSSSSSSTSTVTITTPTTTTSTTPRTTTTSKPTIPATFNCPGAPVSSYGHGLIDCSKAPVCHGANYPVGYHEIHSPHQDPTKYYVCYITKFDLHNEPDLSRLEDHFAYVETRKCIQGMCYSHDLNRCAIPSRFKEHCKR